MNDQPLRDALTAILDKHAWAIEEGHTGPAVTEILATLRVTDTLDPKPTMQQAREAYVRSISMPDTPTVEADHAFDPDCNACQHGHHRGRP